MTDALQQRSRYQCALKTMKNASHASSEECTYQGIPSIYSYNIDVSSVIVAGSLQNVHSKQKTWIKYLVSSISLSSKHCRSAPNNTIVEWEENSRMAAFIFLVDYCPIINNKLSQLGSVSSRFNVYPCLICR